MDQTEAATPRPPTPRPHVLGLPRGYVIVPESGETLLEAARRLDVPLASSCAGRAICGDCVVRVLAGAASLTPPDVAERAWAARTRPAAGLRLACRLRAFGDATVATTYW